ncbi:MAG: hypothetical protein K6G24_06210 [Lachnospiraceae bacterium]|nr:hypothetical protein [Lachnospiraceae bacterium]
METKRKNMIVKLLIRLTGVMLALGMVFGTFSAAEVGVKAAKKTKTEQESSKPTKKQIRKFAKKVGKANNIEKLLKKYNNILVFDTGFVAYADKECSYTMTYRYKYASYADKDTACSLVWENDEPVIEYFLPLDKETDIYDATYARDYFEGDFSPESFLEDEVISLKEENGRIIYIGRLNKENTEDVKEAWELETDAEQLCSEFVVDAETYEVIYEIIYDENDEDKEPLVTTMYFYDAYEENEKLEECTLMRAMAKRTELGTVTCTVVVDPGTENEYTRKITVPTGEPLYFKTTEIEKIAYKNAKCTKKIKEWDTKSDLTMYVKSIQTKTEE